MGSAEWIAFGVFALALISGIVHIVWLLASMKATLQSLVRRAEATDVKVTEHVKDCDEDRLHLNHRVSHLEGT